MRLPFLNQTGNESLKSILIKAAISNFGYKVIFTGLIFLTSVVLSRTLGAEGFGHYTFAITWVNLLSIPCIMGCNELMSREIPRRRETGQWGLAAGLVKWSHRTSLVLALAMSLFGVLFLLLVNPRMDPVANRTLMISMAIVPCLTLMRVQQGAIRGFGKIVKAQLSQILFRPLFFLILFVGAMGFWRPTAPITLSLRVVAVSLALMVSFYYLNRYMPVQVRTAHPRFERTVWLKSGFGLTLAATASVVLERIDIILVGSLLGPAETGLYEVSLKGAQLMLFLPVAVNLTIGPAISRLHGKGDIKKLQELISKSVAISFLAAMGLGAVFFLFGQYYLRIFGPEFAQAAGILKILCGACLVHVMFGATSIILNMTGNEGYTIICLVIGIFVNVLLTLVFIPRWGLEGVAWAQFIGTVAYKALLSYCIYLKTGIHSYFPGGYVAKYFK